MSEITNTQLLFLDNLIYLDLSEFENETLKSTIQEIIKDIGDYVSDENNPPASMTKSQWVELLESFLNNKENEVFLKDIQYKITKLMILMKMVCVLVVL